MRTGDVYRMRDHCRPCALMLPQNPGVMLLADGLECVHDELCTGERVGKLIS